MTLSSTRTALIASWAKGNEMTLAERFAEDLHWKEAHYAAVLEAQRRFAAMTPQDQAWHCFRQWYQRDGHWVYGCGAEGWDAAVVVWQQDRLDHLPKYPGTGPTRRT